MHRFAPAATLGIWLALTNPQGVTIFVDSESIAVVTPGGSYCSPSTLTRIDMGQNAYCVRESVAEVVRQIKDAPRSKNDDD